MSGSFTVGEAVQHSLLQRAPAHGLQQCQPRKQEDSPEAWILRQYGHVLSTNSPRRQEEHLHVPALGAMQLAGIEPAFEAGVWLIQKAVSLLSHQAAPLSNERTNKTLTLYLRTACGTQRIKRRLAGCCLVPQLRGPSQCLLLFKKEKHPNLALERLGLPEGKEDLET